MVEWLGRKTSHAGDVGSNPSRTNVKSFNFVLKMALKVCSINVNGFRSVSKLKNKRDIVLEELKWERVDVAFIQETHSVKNGGKNVFPEMGC